MNNNNILFSYLTKFKINIKNHNILFSFLVALIIYPLVIVLLIIFWFFLIHIIATVLLAILLEKCFGHYMIKLPKPFLFVEYELESSVPSTIFTNIPFLVLSAAFVYSSSIFFEFSEDVASSLFINIAKFILETIIGNTTRMHIEISAYLSNTPFSFHEYTQIHAYLTPYIRSYDSIFSWTMNWVNFLDASNSSDFAVLEEMQGRYRVAGNNLLELYRNIETSLNISIQDSPIAIQDWEYVE